MMALRGLRRGMEGGGRKRWKESVRTGSKARLRAILLLVGKSSVVRHNEGFTVVFACNSSELRRACEVGRKSTEVQGDGRD
jgi:hypothetical protein